MTAIIVPDQPTGQQLVDAVHELAVATGKTTYDVARLLSDSPSKWLDQVSVADRPTALTVQRVRALVAGEPIPPAKALARAGARREADRPLKLRPSMPVYRAPSRDPHDRRPEAWSSEPCRLCQVRGDLGCAHQSPYAGARALIDRPKPEAVSVAAKPPKVVPPSGSSDFPDGGAVCLPAGENS